MIQTSELSSKLLIDGQWVETFDTSSVINPTTEQVIGEAAEGTPELAEEAARAARAAQPAWAVREDRAEIFQRISKSIAAGAEDLIDLTMREGGFTRSMATGFTQRAIDLFVDAAKATTQISSIPTPPQVTPLPDGTTDLLNGEIQRRPIGVAACIIPFNGPLFGAALKSSKALAMGNTVVLKAPPQNPLAVAELFQIFQKAGLPPGVANLVTGSDPRVGETLTHSRNVDAISFTGSTAVGKKVYEAGAGTMKRMILELGGKGACLVLQDADVNRAVRGISTVWTVNSGQICSAPTRAIVHRSIYREVVDKLNAAAQQVRVGSPFDPATIAGPVISDTQRNRIVNIVDSARDQGAHIMTGDGRPDLDLGYFVAPTLIAEAHNQMTAAREEIFGPVVCVIPFEDEDEAIAIANDTDFGLSSYIYSRDTARAYRLAASLQAGIIQINTNAMKLDMPRGGVKMSGISREGGEMGMHAFTEPHSVVWA